MQCKAARIPSGGFNAKVPLQGCSPVLFRLDFLAGGLLGASWRHGRIKHRTCRYRTATRPDKVMYEQGADGQHKIYQLGAGMLNLLKTRDIYRAHRALPKTDGMDITMLLAALMPPQLCWRCHHLHKVLALFSSCQVPTQVFWPRSRDGTKQSESLPVREPRRNIRPPCLVRCRKLAPDAVPC